MLARLIVDRLGVDASKARDIDPHGSIIGSNLCRNMRDVLEVADQIEEQFDVSFADPVNTCAALASIASLASFIRRQAPFRIVASLPTLDVKSDETGMTRPEGGCR
jgi:hypothetical protein